MRSLLRWLEPICCAKSRLHGSMAWRQQKAQVAQSVEQWTENPRVGGSIPPLGTIFSRPELFPARSFLPPADAQSRPSCGNNRPAFKPFASRRLAPTVRQSSPDSNAPSFFEPCLYGINGPRTIKAGLHTRKLDPRTPTDRFRCRTWLARGQMRVSGRTGSEPAGCGSRQWAVSGSVEVAQARTTGLFRLSREQPPCLASRFCLVKVESGTRRAMPKCRRQPRNSALSRSTPRKQRSMATMPSRVACNKELNAQRASTAWSALRGWTLSCCIVDLRGCEPAPRRPSPR